MKQDSFGSFLVKLLALSAILYLTLYLFFNNVVIMPAMPYYLIIGSLFVVTALSHYLVVKAKDKDPRVFTYTYMSTSVGRLILYSIVIFAYCFGHRDVAKVFVATFFVMYIIYSAFEVRTVRTFLKK